MINSSQTIESWGDCDAEHQDWSNNATEDYMGIKNDVSTLIGLLNSGAISPQLGEGSPEGVVTSNYSLKYIDTLIPTEYYNPEFGSDTGWISL
jgi:hypothetical protein